MFRVSAKGVLREADLEVLQRDLLRDPGAGAVVAGCGGARKIRLGLPGRGKRGGVRVIYFAHVRAARIYLLLTYPKNAAENLSPKGRHAVKDAITAIERER